MKADLRALSDVMMPLTEDEAAALSSLGWLEGEQNLPDSIRAYFMARLERAIDALLPADAREPLRGCTDVLRFRAALDAHFAKRRKLRAGATHLSADTHPPQVSQDPDVMGGTPVLAGSRLPVETLLGCVDAGDPWDRLVRSWPWLTKAHVEAARRYAEHNDISIRSWWPPRR